LGFVGADYSIPIPAGQWAVSPYANIDQELFQTLGVITDRRTQNPSYWKDGIQGGVFDGRWLTKDEIIRRANDPNNLEGASWSESGPGPNRYSNFLNYTGTNPSADSFVDKIGGLLPIIGGALITAGAAGAFATAAEAVAPSIVAPAEGLIPIAPTIEAAPIADVTAAFDAAAIPESALAPIPESVISPTMPASFPTEVASSVMDKLPQFHMPSLTDALKFAASKLLAPTQPSTHPSAPLPHQVTHSTLTTPNLTAGAAAPTVGSPVPWVILGLLLLKAIL
jgi:hypothetical protein